MCLLIIQRENTNIDDGSLKNAFDSNPDGVGYSFIDSKNNNPRMVTKKFKRYKKFLDNYKADILRYVLPSPYTSFWEFIIASSFL